MSVVLFLVTPYRSGATGIGTQSRRHRERRWYVPGPVIEWIDSRLATTCVPSAIDTSICGSLHAVARCSIGTIKSHPAHVCTQVDRRFREYYFATRHQTLSKLVWSTVLDVAVIRAPVPLHHFDVTSLQGGPQHDCFYADINHAIRSQVFVLGDGTDIALSDLLNTWAAVEGCNCTASDRRLRDRYVAVQCPAPFLKLVVTGLEQSLCVCDVWSKRSTNILKFLCGGAVPDVDERSNTPVNFSLESRLFERAAELLRDGSTDDVSDEHSLAPSRDDIVVWLDAMERLGQKPQRCYAMCTHLKGDRHLRDVIVSAFEQVGLSPDLLAGMRQPSRSTLCRWRFYVNAGLCLLLRCFFANLLSTDAEFTLYFLADGSPRVGRELSFQE